MADDEPKTKKIENPLLAFVPGGTRTAASERLFEERFRESEKRRDADAAMKRAASQPAEPGRITTLSTHKLTRNPEVPQGYVLLHYLNRYGSKVPPGECCADIWITDWDNPNNLTLNLICRRCYLEGVKHPQDCQIQVKMSNRWWQLEAGKGPKFFLHDDGSGPRSYPSAGVIAESERFTCPDCNWRAQIVNNTIREE